jgi:hypothetical protein
MGSKTKSEGFFLRKYFADAESGQQFCKKGPEGDYLEQSELGFEFC